MDILKGSQHIYLSQVYKIYPYILRYEYNRADFQRILRRVNRIASSRSDENGQDQVEAEWPIFSKLRKVTGRSFPQEETRELKNISVTVSRPKCSSDTPGGFPQVTASFHSEESAHKSTCTFREKGRNFLKKGQFRRLS
jgi:hypothetical protein